MEQTKEISALLNLIDDPDEEVLALSRTRSLILEEPLYPTLNIFGKPHLMNKSRSVSS
jgi:hypothetical protein